MNFIVGTYSIIGIHYIYILWTNGLYTLYLLKKNHGGFGLTNFFARFFS